MKKWFLSLTVIALGTAGLFAPTPASAKTTYLPRTIRHHTFYRLTDGAQGGLHDKTTFTGNRMRVGHWTWRLTHVRKQNARPTSPRSTTRRSAPNPSKSRSSAPSISTSYPNTSCTSREPTRATNSTVPQSLSAKIAIRKGRFPVTGKRPFRYLLTLI